MGRPGQWLRPPLPLLLLPLLLAARCDRALAQASPSPPDAQAGSDPTSALDRRGLSDFLSQWGSGQGDEGRTFLESRMPSSLRSKLQTGGVGVLPRAGATRGVVACMCTVPTAPACFTVAILQY